MKQLKAFKNWRIIALTVMAVAAFVLIVGESDNVAALVITKFLGFAVGVFCYRIWKDWKDKGQIDINNETEK